MSKSKQPHATDDNKNSDQNTPSSPFAKYPGILALGESNVDCYVLDTGDRVISLRSAVKSLTGIDGSALEEYIGVKSLKPYINSSLVVEELLEFSLPGQKEGSQFATAKGITAERFLDICRAYVSAFTADALSEKPTLTQRQKEIAVQANALLVSCAKVGLIALIDEATGYQYERQEDALQIKLRAFIAEELRAWEKTFPDELWEEFGRLTHWTGPLHNRPKWWGKLVIELIYDTLDPDVAEYLKTHKPPSGTKWHQQLTDNYGVRQLVSRCFEIIGVAKTCSTMPELRDKVAHHYGKEPIQLTIFLPSSRS